MPYADRVAHKLATIFAVGHLKIGRQFDPNVFVPTASGLCFTLEFLFWGVVFTILLEKTVAVLCKFSGPLACLKAGTAVGALKPVSAVAFL